MIYGLQFVATDEKGEHNLGEPYLFTAPDASKVSDIFEESGEAQYIGLDGVLYREQPTAPGIYLKRTGNKVEKFVK